MHTYVDASADLEQAKAIITNAKTRRVSVCNALDTLVFAPGSVTGFAGNDAVNGEDYGSRYLQMKTPTKHWKELRGQPAARIR